MTQHREPASPAEQAREWWRTTLEGLSTDRKLAITEWAREHLAGEITLAKDASYAEGFAEGYEDGRTGGYHEGYDAATRDADAREQRLRRECEDLVDTLRNVYDKRIEQLRQRCDELAQRHG